jgi:hypothetical protein
MSTSALWGLADLQHDTDAHATADGEHGKFEMIRTHAQRADTRINRYVDQVAPAGRASCDPAR